MLEALFLMCLGDSLTAQGFCDVAGSHSATITEVVSHGVEGADSQAWRPGPYSLMAEVDPADLQRADVIHIMLGTNDANYSRSASEYLGNLHLLLDALPDRSMVLVSMPPFMPGGGWDRLVYLNSYREMVVSLVNSRPNVCLGVDAWEAIRSADDLEWNGAHPNESGQRALGEALAVRVEELTLSGREGRRSRGGYRRNMRRAQCHSKSS